MLSFAIIVLYIATSYLSNYDSASRRERISNSL